MGRVRQGRRFPPPAEAPLRLSDLLLFRASGTGEVVDSLGEALPRMRGSRVWRQGEIVGVYLEIYGPEELDDLGVTVSLESAEEPGFFRRVGEAVGLVDPDAPLEIAWLQSSSGGRHGGSWTLDLSDIEPGEYVLRMRVTGGTPEVGVTTAEATRTIRVAAAGADGGRLSTPRGLLSER